MAFVEFRDVRKIYQMGETQVCAADGLNFDIEQGELACIVGPSGSGKTTLLNMLGGMDTCTSGTITLAGREISAFGEKELVQYRRHEIGFVFQFYNLVQNLTALENVELAAQICEDPMPADEVASNSASQSHVRWRRTPNSCFATSLPVRLTTRRARRSCICCRRRPPYMGARWSSSRITPPSNPSRIASSTSTRARLPPSS
mgnify:CR=1 FL=1